jgi:hypothetical protein
MKPVLPPPSLNISNSETDDGTKELARRQHIMNIANANLPLFSKLFSLVPDAGNDAIAAMVTHGGLMVRFLNSVCMRFGSLSKAIRTIKPGDILVCMTDMSLYGIYDTETYAAFTNEISLVVKPIAVLGFFCEIMFVSDALTIDNINTRILVYADVNFQMIKMQETEAKTIIGFGVPTVKNICEAREDCMQFAEYVIQNNRDIDGDVNPPALTIEKNQCEVKINFNKRFPNMREIGALARSVYKDTPVTINFNINNQPVNVEALVASITGRNVPAVNINKIKQ